MSQQQSRQLTEALVIGLVFLTCMLGAVVLLNIPRFPMHSQVRVPGP